MWCRAKCTLLQSSPAHFQRGGSIESLRTQYGVIRHTWILGCLASTGCLRSGRDFATKASGSVVIGKESSSGIICRRCTFRRFDSAVGAVWGSSSLSQDSLAPLAPLNWANNCEDCNGLPPPIQDHFWVFVHVSMYVPQMPSSARWAGNAALYVGAIAGKHGSVSCAGCGGPRLVPPRASTGAHVPRDIRQHSCARQDCQIP